MGLLITVKPPAPRVRSDYHFKFWTPAKSTISVSQFLTRNLGLIGTIQYIQWNIFQVVNHYNIAVQTRSGPMIASDLPVHYHFQNTWLLTLGTQYRLSPEWIIRFAGTYNQSPSNGNLQLSQGDVYVLGGSMGYQLLKNCLLDFSYSHAFIINESIQVTAGRNLINGNNRGAHDSVALKLTVTI